MLINVTTDAIHSFEMPIPTVDNWDDILDHAFFIMAEFDTAELGFIELFDEMVEVMYCNCGIHYYWADVEIGHASHGIMIPE